MPSSTSAVSRSGSVITPRVSTPSRASSSRMKRPMCSSPTRVISADFSPSRAVPAGDVGGRAADVFLKRPHVLQPPADLRAVKIDRGPADGDDVQHVSLRCRMPDSRRGRIASAMPIRNIYSIQRNLQPKILSSGASGADRHRQRQRQRHRGRQRAEGAEIDLGHQKAGRTDCGAAGWSVASVSATTGRPRSRASLRQIEGFVGIGREGDREQRITGAQRVRGDQACRPRHAASPEPPSFPRHRPR